MGLLKGSQEEHTGDAN